MSAGAEPEQRASTALPSSGLPEEEREAQQRLATTAAAEPTICAPSVLTSRYAFHRTRAGFERSGPCGLVSVLLEVVSKVLLVCLVWAALWLLATEVLVPWTKEEV